MSNQNTKMRVAVLGAGAMGSWFGGLLATQGHSVQLLTTNTAHRDAITLNGLLLKAPEYELIVSIKALEPAQMVAPVDLILLMTKTFQTRDAMKSIAHAIDESTHVLSLQNGLGNAETIAQFIPQERTWIGVSMMPIDKVTPGVVTGKGHGSSYFGNAAKLNDQPIAAQIEASFKAASIELHHDSTIHQRIWEKVAFNSGMNALSALSSGTPGTIGRLPDAQELAINVAKEVADVAAVLEIHLDFKRVTDMIHLSCTKHGEHVPSMLQDIQSKRRTEVDALSGAIVQLAKKACVPVPLNATLTTLIKLAELANSEHTS